MRHHRTDTLVITLAAAGMIAATIDAGHRNQPAQIAGFALIAMLLAHLAHREYLRGIEERLASRAEAVRADRQRRFGPPAGEGEGWEWCCERQLMLVGREHSEGCPRSKVDA
ncbi:hypothetical protein IPZ58_07710 [Streptomyces roseoverticillatus]|uniref:hypothetical protein n=1 Tax=Streptomyces roseoverticillatus TaxID=66429 RepID=UPI001F29E9E5|nr:hypothetical protein [Streptomyces roseoverticillatus]MCF3101465.1 hypothetical protein [Streptomyces roseoverticillatus]